MKLKLFAALACGVLLAAQAARAALTLLLDAELNAKRSGPPPEAICRDALLRIARRVAEARRTTAFQES